MRGRALSYIEVLIAVAIAAVIISILVPVAAAARERANRKTCMSNIHNVALAAQLYAADSHDTLLPMRTGKQTYDQLLEPYVMIKNIWSCPEAKSNLPRTLGLNRAIGVSFGVEDKHPVSASTIETPGNTIAFTEAPPSELGGEIPAGRAPHVTQACEAAYRDRHNLVNSPEEGALERHRGKGNYAFADGSARALTAAQTIYPRIQWFVKPQPATDFLTEAQTEDDCDKIGLAGAPAGRDPVTKN